jgi:hypothetical protein
MLHSEIIAVCSKIHIKHVNTLCGQNVEFVSVKPGGIYRITHKYRISDLFGTVAVMVTSGVGEGETCQQRVRHSKSLSYVTGDRYVHPLSILTKVSRTRSMAPAGLFVSQRTGSHSAGIPCTTQELFCPYVVLCGTWSESSVAPSQLIQFC